MRRKIFFYALFFILSATGLIFIQSEIVSLSTAHLITADENKVPDFAFVLVLGSGNTPDTASRNLSFGFRMAKAARLYKAKKPREITVSGVSNIIYYNEPNDMKNELIELGVPGSILYPDHGGQRTFLSVKRMKSRVGVEPFIIISQRNQLERALYIARCLGVECSGLEAAPVPRMKWWAFEVHEILARAKCQVECIFNRN